MKDPIERQDAIDAIKAIPDGNWSSKRYETAIKELPPAQPDWGKSVGDGRPLADSEVIPRLQDIKRQIGGSYAIERAIEVLEGLPLAQPEIIRCKDCENWDKTWTNDFPPNHHYCPMVDGVRDENFYCADAERREE